MHELSIMLFTKKHDLDWNFNRWRAWLLWYCYSPVIALRICRHFTASHTLDSSICVRQPRFSAFIMLKMDIKVTRQQSFAVQQKRKADEALSGQNERFRSNSLALTSGNDQKAYAANQDRRHSTTKQWQLLWWTLHSYLPTEETDLCKHCWILYWTANLSSMRWKSGESLIIHSQRWSTEMVLTIVCCGSILWRR